MNSLLEQDKIKKLNILYIDDNIDPFIAEYLMEEYKYQDVEIEYGEILFNNDNNYETLLNDIKIRLANIIVMDSALFQESKVTNLFTGEEFKIILKKYFPFIEVIIISQNQDISHFGIIEKFKESKREKKGSNEYYNETLKPLLDASIENMKILKNILKKLNKNENLNKILKNKIENSMSGIVEYDELTSKDIDNLIEEFKKLEKRFK